MPTTGRVLGGGLKWGPWAGVGGEGGDVLEKQENMPMILLKDRKRRGTKFKGICTD